MSSKMTGGLEQDVLTILRERHLFDIAARTHSGWSADLEAKYPRGPRGGLNPIVRAARKTQDKIASFGPEALVDDLLPHFVYAAERWQQMSDPEVKQLRPFLQYFSAQLPTSRLSHKEKHGVILPVDDPFWNTWYPPNGFNCLCTVASVSAREMSREGLALSRKKFTYANPDEGFDFNIGKVLS